MNLLLGIPGIVTNFLAWYLLSNGPLSDLGWTFREPTENDGTLVLVMFLGPLVLFAAAVWGIVNWLLLRRQEEDAPAIRHWTACIIAFFLPTLAAMGYGLWAMGYGLWA